MEELAGNGYGSDSPSTSEETRTSPRLQARMVNGIAKKRPAPDLPSVILPRAQVLFDAKDTCLESLASAGTTELGNGDEVPEWKRPRPDGRVLSFPPELGTHPVLVFVPVSLPKQQASELVSLISAIRSHGLPFKIHPLTSELEPDESRARNDLSIASSSQMLHISLSRVLPIKFHLVESLVQELKSRISITASAFRPTTKQPLRVCVSSTTSFVNDERTRSFASLAIRDVEGSIALLHNMIVAVNHVFTMHGLQTYYKSPQLHVSFAWAAGDHKEELGEALRGEIDCFTPTNVDIGSIVCRIGKIDNLIWPDHRTA